MDIQIQKAQKTPKKVISKNINPRNILIKILKVKYKRENLEAIRVNDALHTKQTSYPHKNLSASFSGETFQAKREWDDIQKVLIKRQQRIPYQENYPLEIKEILRHSQINKS